MLAFTKQFINHFRQISISKITLGFEGPLITQQLNSLAYRSFQLSLAQKIRKLNLKLIFLTQKISQLYLKFPKITKKKKPKSSVMAFWPLGIGDRQYAGVHKPSGSLVGCVPCTQQFVCPWSCSVAVCLTSCAHLNILRTHDLPHGLSALAHAAWLCSSYWTCAIVYYIHMSKQFVVY